LGGPELRFRKYGPLLCLSEKRQPVLPGMRAEPENSGRGSKFTRENFDFGPPVEWFTKREEQTGKHAFFQDSKFGMKPVFSSKSVQGRTDSDWQGMLMGNIWHLRSGRQFP
jgi:hypothetical protein